MKPEQDTHGKRTLAGQLTFRLALSVFSVSLFVACLFIVATYVSEKSKQRTIATVDADFLAHALERPLWDLDTATARQICQAYCQKEEVVWFTLVTTGADTIITFKKDKRYSITKQIAVNHNNEKIGTVFFALSDHHILNSLQQLTLITCVIISIILLLQWYLLKKLIKGQLSEPLAWLEKTVSNNIISETCPEKWHAPVTEFEPFGAVLRIMGQTISRQMDDLRELNKEIKQSEERTRAIFNRMFSLIGLLSPEGNLIEANQTALDFIGVDNVENLQGKPFWDTPWWNHSSQVQEQIRNAIARAAAGELVHEETLHVAGDGSEHIVDFIITPVYDDSGALVYLIPEGRDITESKKAQTALEESQVLLASTINSTDDLICTVDAHEFRILMFNDALKAYYISGGIDLKVGLCFIDIAEESRRAEWRKLFQKVLQTGTYSVEYKTTYQKRILDLTLHVIKKDGIPCIISMFGRDITARAQAEALLRESESRYRFIAQHTADVIWVLDVDSMRFTYVSPSVEKLRGYTPEEAIAQPASASLTPKSFKFVSDVLAIRIPQFLKGENTTQSMVNEVDQPCKDGSIVHTEVMTTIILNEKGKIEILGVSRDITERKRNELKLKAAHQQLEALNQQLSASNLQLTAANQELTTAYYNLAERDARFTQLADSISEIFWLFDIATNKFIYVNKAFEAIWGMTIEEAYTLSPWDPTHIVVEDQPVWLEVVQKLQHGVTDKTSVDFRINRTDGQIRWLRSRISTIKDDEGKLFRIAAITSDITVLKEAAAKERLHQMQLIQADKMASLGVLVSGVAHEINNPNNFIMLNAKILKKAWHDILPVLRDYYIETGDFLIADIPFSKSYDRLKELIQGVGDGADRIKNIVQNLKDFARKDSGELNQNVDINKVVQSSLQIVNTMIQKSTDHFTVLYGEDIPLIKGNFQQLEQVVINLLSNACQALPDPSKGIGITTYLDKDRNYVKLVVKDEGTGIANEDLEHIMDPFYTTKRDRGGTGLGLSISYNIIKNHNGAIDMLSNTGEGTTVTMVLPVEPEPHQQEN